MRTVEAYRDSGNMEWELSKENVQPLKTGRNVDVLNDALKSKAEGPARSSIFENQRRQFLEAIEDYDGEDPLVPWIRYIKWVNDAYPAGGAQSELLKLLERCVLKFQKNERYRRDVRYLRIWVQYADCCADPSDVFAFLEANDIGQDYALFYEAYATSMEVRRKFSKADEIYNLGLQRSARPLGRLESMYKSFLNRMHRRGERKLREEQQPVAATSYSENDVQFRSFGPKAVCSGDAAGQQARGHRARPVSMLPPRQRTSRSGNAEVSIFVDPEFGGMPKMTSEEDRVRESQAAPWCHMGSAADKTKENVQKPVKWSDTKIGQEAHFQGGRRSDLNILVDEEFAEEHNNKSHRSVSKSAAPSLRLRLEDMQKTRRQSPNLKGSFLDFAEAYPQPKTTSSVEYISECSGKVPTNDTAAKKSHPEAVFGYQTSVLCENGIERSFEEFRLLIWNKMLQTCDTEEKENISTNIAHPENFEDGFSSLHPSINPATEMVKGSTELGGMTGNICEVVDTVRQSSSSQRNDNGCEDVFIPRGDLFSVCSNQQSFNDARMKSDSKTIVNHISRESAVADQNTLTDCQLQPQTILPSSSEGLAIVHLRPLNSFSMQGDETVAIKRFAEEVIVLGSDAKVNSIDSVSHLGLVEPTINTKEALADILDMFNKPLECDNAQSKIRKSKRCSFPVGQSSGFQIFEDEDLEIQSSAEAKKTDKRVKATSGRSCADPVIQTRGLQIFADENLVVHSPVQTCNNDGAINKPFDLLSQPTGFHVYKNDDLDVQGFDISKTSLGKIRASISNSPLHPLVQSTGSDIFELEDSNLPRARKSDDYQIQAQSATCNASNPVSDSGAFQVFVDDNLVIKETVQQPTKNGDRIKATPLEASCYDSVRVDDELQELPIGLDGIIVQTQANWSLAEDKVAVRRLFETDGVGVPQASDAAVPIMVNPWDEKTLQDLLIRLKPQMIHYEGFYESSEKYNGSVSISSLRSSNARNKILQLGSSTYRLKGCIGQGAFAQVFEVEDEDDDLFGNATKLALKFQKPGCPWEFYIYNQLDLRISTQDRPYYGRVRRFHLYSDSSFMVCDYGDKGTLQDVVNAYLAMGLRMDEVLCMFYTIEMLRMLEILHGVGIIHGDFKPDNLLIRDDSDELESWTPDPLGCWKSQGLSLIDWGRSIDISLYPEGIQFKGDCKTDSFRCPEMLEQRSWCFQVDTYGLCGVVHCLLHGNYMQIEKTQTADAQIVYRPKSTYKRYWNVELWKNFFETLLNVNTYGHKTPLSELRKTFEGHLVDNSLGKKLKGLLAKQTIMMFTRR